MNSQPSDMLDDQLSALVLRRVGDFVEPITRFDRSKLVPVGSAVLLTPFTATQFFEVSFYASTKVNTGSLPAGVTRAGDAAQVTKSANLILGRARTDLPQRLAAWDAASHGATSARLTSQDCFDQPPAIGYDYSCSSCSGRGNITCSECRGQGEVTCTGCRGSKETSCTPCSGNGELICTMCFGAKKYSECETRNITDYNTGSTRIEYVYVDRPCMGCHGSGSLRCLGCWGTGKETCWRCRGMGKVECTSCRGTGVISCVRCAGTGWLNTRTTVSCQVNESLEIQPVTDDEEIRRTLRLLRPVDRLSALSGPIAYSGQVQGHRLERRFAGTVSVAVLHLNVEEEVLSIYGFGPHAEIMDFKNVAGALLRGDLNQLNRALAQKRRFGGVQNDLRIALGQCLESEANVRIVEQFVQGETHLAHLVRGELQRGIADDYAVEAGRSISMALGRAFRAETFYTSLATVILAAVVQIVGAAATSWPGLHLLVATWMILALFGYAAFSAKTRCFLRRFDLAVRDKIVLLLPRLQIRRRMARWTGGLAVTVSLVAFVLILALKSGGPLSRTWSRTETSQLQGAPTSAGGIPAVPRDRCSVAALACEQFLSGLVGQALGEAAVKARKEGHGAQAICLARAAIDRGATDRKLRGAMWFQIASAWKSQGCIAAARDAIASSLIVLPHGAAGWRDACDLCRQLGEVDCRACGSLDIRKAKLGHPPGVAMGSTSPSPPAATSGNGLPLEKIEHEYFDHRTAEALRDGEQIYHEGRDPRALRIAVMAACEEHQAGRAQADFDLLPEDLRDGGVCATCSDAGIRLTPSCGAQDVK